jgi:hypothetical protein
MLGSLVYTKVYHIANRVSIGAPLTLRARLRRKELLLLGILTARVNSCPDTCLDRGYGVEGEKLQRELSWLTGIYSSARVVRIGNMPGYDKLHLVQTETRATSMGVFFCDDYLPSILRFAKASPASRAAFSVG